jgi:hypothetical protein
MLRRRPPDAWLALLVLDQRDGDGIGFTHHLDRYGVAVIDPASRAQPFQCEQAALARAHAQLALLAARLHLVGDEVLHDACRSNILGQCLDAGRRFAAHVVR